MRLGQLARKLSLRPSQLVDFLTERNIPTEEGSNTRLEDSHAEMIVRHFSPESLEEFLKPSITETVTEESVVEPIREVEAVSSESITDTKQETAENLVEPSESNGTEQEQQSSEPEVIRVQKIELSGLKVLGKIDLPEPKKKEPKAESETSSSEQKPERKGRRSNAKQTRIEREQRPWRNPVETQRKREAQELEEKKKAELEREKERKKNHYQSRVKQIQQPKKVKAVKEKSAAKKPVDKRPAPKTLLGKFFRWWTT